MDHFKEIITDQPILYVWKMLRYFLDNNYSATMIRNLHNIPNGKHEENVLKQARQIAYCIRQAEEYFRAASQVSLITRPTLLYYGVVSLSQALVLLRQDGDFSIDALRKERKHNHHGLDLVRGLTTLKPSLVSLNDFLKNLCAEIHAEQNKPWGHFALFFRSIQPSASFVHLTITDRKDNYTVRTEAPYQCPTVPDLDSLLGRKFAVFDLVRSLPDLYHMLIEFEIEPNLARGSVSYNIDKIYQSKDDAEYYLAKVSEVYKFNLDDVSDGFKRRFLDVYLDKNPKLQVILDVPGRLSLNMQYEYDVSDKQGSGYLPDFIDDIYGRPFYISKPEEYMPEPVAMLMITYCLGMLSRYYPDIWVATVDKNIRVAEVTDFLLNIIHRKFPVLILDQLTSIKHYIHS